MRDAQGEDGHVVVSVAGVVIGQGLNEVRQGQGRVGGCEFRQCVQALVEGVRGVFDEPVGEEDHGGIGGKGVGVVGAVLLAVDVQGQSGFGEQVLRLPVGGDQQRGTWPALLQCSLQAPPAGSMRARLTVVMGLSVMACRV